MAKPMVKLFTNLENEFQTLQKSLSDIDSDIRKVTGKDPGQFEGGPPKFVRNRLRSINSDSARRFNPLNLNLKRRNDSVDREDESESKRGLKSHVVATSWEPRQRTQVLEEQKNDTKSLSRNRRMFGLILGTLEKFKSEESQRKDTKRDEIEQKLDKADEQEREALKKERRELFQKRKIKRAQLRCLEKKMSLIEVHKEWEKSHQSLGSFIETKTKPNIFFMPVKHNTETARRLQETKDKYRIIFAEKRAKVQKELDEIEEQFKQECVFNGEDIKQEIEEADAQTAEEIIGGEASLEGEVGEKTTNGDAVVPIGHTKADLKETMSDHNRKSSSSLSTEVDGTEKKEEDERHEEKGAVIGNGVTTVKETESHKEEPTTDKDFEPMYE